ncbi:MAG: biotin--[Thermoguttaceae bacterium]|nr:biotin--[acetyl-CoA-carboxylase] ligase [Thermoguttaceae bacterium]
MRGDNVKSRVLSELAREKGARVSGQELADSLGVTRAAVWKAIEKLREEGVPIDGASNKGYLLDPAADVLAEGAVRPRLSSGANPFYSELIFLKETTSTNDVLREERFAATPQAVVVCAERQTAGRGRYGRTFQSPRGSGLYFSLLLRPNREIEAAVLVTAVAAVAGARACEKIAPNRATGDVKIKWVNDLYLDGKKICGVLTEGTVSAETRKMERAILGVGFNLTVDPKDFPPELVDRVGGLFPIPAPPGARAALLAAFLDEFRALYDPLFVSDDPTRRAEARESLLREYRDRQLLVGERIEVAERLDPDAKPRLATALGVDDDFRLLVAYDDDRGRVVALNGEEARVAGARR